MAGAATDSSRMGITLQGYNQVIALSQANVNETLSRHFSGLNAADDLKLFEADLGESSPNSISATVLAPQIELIDEDNNDKAVYIIRLGEGFFSTAVRINRKLELVEIPTQGWELAFEIDFAFKPVKQIPTTIAQQVPLAGGYSVKQLMINFGDFTRILQLKPGRSKFPLSSAVAKGITEEFVEATLKVFTQAYINGKLATRTDHNILGFVVNVTQEPGNLKPEFIPTESKVQIIGHRVGGNKDTFKPENPYNAFCFTEMTDNRKMPDTEIKYSGNWFYESIGGTLAMSRGTFWDLFMVSKFKEAHVKAVEISAGILDKISSDKFKGKSWCLDDPKPDRGRICGPHKNASSLAPLAYGTTYKCSELEHWNKDDSVFINFWSKPRSTVTTTARPTARKGEIIIQQDIDLSFEEGGKLSNYAFVNLGTLIASVAFNAYIQSGLGLTIQTTLTLKAVTNDGSLQVDTKTEVTRNDYRDLKINIGGLGDYLPNAVINLINDWSELLSDNYKKAKEDMATEVKKIYQVFSGSADELAKGLNNGNKFVFPGNGTFDMKDPVFSDEGNLMVGLTFR